MSDRGVMTSKVGTASLGVLLFQDLAVVPFIILLPILQKLQGGELGADGGLDSRDHGGDDGGGFPRSRRAGVVWVSSRRRRCTGS